MKYFDCENSDSAKKGRQKFREKETLRGEKCILLGKEIYIFCHSLCNLSIMNIALEKLSFLLFRRKHN